MSIIHAFPHHQEIYPVAQNAWTMPTHQPVQGHHDMGLQHLQTCPTDLALIQQGEGFRSCKYLDTMGIPTICYGYNLKNGSARADISSVGGNFDQVMSGAQCLSQAQCTTLLQKRVNVARSGESAIFGNSITCACAKNVLVDMTYNLGQAGLASFNQFNSLMKQGKWAAAAQDLAGTAYCRQVGTRCTRNQNIIKGC